MGTRRQPMAISADYKAPGWLAVERHDRVAQNHPLMATDRIEAARAGDPAALEQLMREHRAEVVRYAMRLCLSPEDAEDATQEALLALSRYIGSLREVAALSSWLFLAVRTHCLRLARRSIRHVLSLDGDSPFSLEGPNPEEQFVDRQLRHRVAIIVSEIDPGMRDVLIRSDVLGESAREAAEGLGLTADALKSRLHRARNVVKRRLLASIHVGPRARADDRKARAVAPPARKSIS
jgi:RNA polymerase sigma factor (sigma-70 family)